MGLDPAKWRFFTVKNSRILPIDSNQLEGLVLLGQARIYIYICIYIKKTPSPIFRDAAMRPRHDLCLHFIGI